METKITNFERIKPSQEDRIVYIYNDILRLASTLNEYGWSKRMTKGDAEMISILSHRLTGLGNLIYNETQIIKRTRPS